MLLCGIVLRLQLLVNICHSLLYFWSDDFVSVIFLHFPVGGFEVVSAFELGSFRVTESLLPKIFSHCCCSVEFCKSRLKLSECPGELLATRLYFKQDRIKLFSAFSANPFNEKNYFCQMFALSLSTILHFIQGHKQILFVQHFG